MRYNLKYMICLVCLLGLTGCSPSTGEMTYTGTYVKASQGQNVLICTTENGTGYFLLQKAKDCKDFDNLETGDEITIYVPCIAYEDEILSERTVYKYEKKFGGHTDVSQMVLDDIEALLSSNNE